MLAADTGCSFFPLCQALVFGTGAGQTRQASRKRTAELALTWLLLSQKGWEEDVQKEGRGSLESRFK